MRCCLRVTCWVKPFPQVIQVKGRSPLWMRSWLHRLTFWVKLLPQVAQLKGLSPLWMRSWACKFPFWEKPFPQKLHLLGRSPVWTKKWTERLVFEWKHLPQTSQRNFSFGFSLENRCFLRRFLAAFCRRNAFPPSLLLKLFDGFCTLTLFWQCSVMVVASSCISCASSSSWASEENSPLCSTENWLSIEWPSNSSNGSSIGAINWSTASSIEFFLECLSDESDEVFCISDGSENSPDAKWSSKLFESASGSYTEDVGCPLEAGGVFPVGVFKIVQIQNN